MSKYSHLWQTTIGGIKHLSSKNEAESFLISNAPPEDLLIKPSEALA
jgi:hypothetical protein